MNVDTKLEKSKFETASIAGKRLVLINDSERYAGEVGKLKNLTGQDSLPYEIKFKQSKGGFTPSALVIVTTNETIQSCDYTSGLARRRISVPMFNRITGDRISLEMVYRGLYYFHGASKRGEAQDPVKYFANPDIQKCLGIVKRKRKTKHKLIIAPFPDQQRGSDQFFFHYSPKSSLTNSLKS